MMIVSYHPPYVRVRAKTVVTVDDARSHSFILSAGSTRQLPVLQTNKGPPLVGLATIACHLAVEAKRPELLGDSAESRAVVQQWLEHRVTRLDGCRKDEVRSLLKVHRLAADWLLMQRAFSYWLGLNEGKLPIKCL